MECNQDYFLSILHRAESAEQVWEDSVPFFEALGFDKLTYLYVRLDACHDDPIAFTTLPAWWSETYLQADHIGSDPLFRFCGSFGVKKTGLDYIDKYPPLTREERVRVEHAGEAGCLTGFASPVKLIGNRRCGGWNFGSSKPKAAFEQISPDACSQAQLMGFYAHERIEALSEARVAVSQDDQVLSPREQECLSFLAAGRRTSCIAKVLGISAATVEFHFKNVKRKLGASTREEALAKAITRGQIAISS